MPHLNGHSNGHSVNGQAGVGGGTLIERDLADPHRKRGTYAILERAVSTGMDMPADTLKAAVGTAIRDMNHNDRRIVARAREFLLAVQKHSVEAAIALDKIERLDGGQDTDRATLSIRYVDETAHRFGSLHAP